MARFSYTLSKTTLLYICGQQRLGEFKHFEHLLAYQKGIYIYSRETDHTGSEEAAVLAHPCLLFWQVFYEYQS